jgi:hypothetical protein
MATFSSFLDILPTPTHPIGDAGQPLATGSGGTNGPGYASMTFSSQAPIQMSRTNSGRVITRSIAGHRWNINITYNPMTREQFEPIYSFLLEKNGRLNPFFIELPQHLTSRNSAFTTYQASNAIDTNATLSAGAGFMIQDGHSSTAATQPQPGDMFTITDTNDSLHTKAYKITRVMNSGTYNTALHSAPGSTQRIVYFTPHLQRSVSQANAVIDYTPLIRVILKTDIQSYNLATNNLYEFSLSLEEAQA